MEIKLLLLFLSTFLSASQGFTFSAAPLDASWASVASSTTRRRRQQQHRRQSSFFDDFEADDFQEDEEDDDDDDEDEYADMDVGAFRSRMMNSLDDDDDNITPVSFNPPSPTTSTAVDDLIARATGRSIKEADPHWVKPVTEIVPGTVLLANPVAFANADRLLLQTYGLTSPPPLALGPDRRADLLPVLLVTSVNESAETRAVLLNRRTGHLLGDLTDNDGNPILPAFCIQPLWFGGMDPAPLAIWSPLDLEGSTDVGQGLSWGGDPTVAQDLIAERNDVSGFDCKFFVQCTVYEGSSLQEQIAQGVFYPCQVSKSLLFANRDRLGTQRAKPLWTDICERLEPDVCRALYEEQE